MSDDYPKFRKACYFRFKVPIKKYDMAEIKHSLENAIRDFLVLEQGYIQDNTLLDRHLVMGYIACISAITSAVYGYTHPFNYDTKVILLVGSAIYFLFTFMTAYQNAYIKKDLCFTGYKKDVLGEKREIKVHLTTDKYSDMIAIKVDLLGSKKSAENTSAKIDVSVANYFTTMGEFAPDSFIQDFVGLLAGNSKKSK